MSSTPVLWAILLAEAPNVKKTGGPAAAWRKQGRRQVCKETVMQKRGPSMAAAGTCKGRVAKAE
jgi:hypothetical protein